MAEVKEKVWVWTYESEGMLRRMIKAGESASVVAKAHRLEKVGVLAKPLTPNVPPIARRRVCLGTDKWPLARRDTLIRLWNAGDVPAEEIARHLGTSAHAVYKKIAGLRKHGFDLRVRQAKRGCEWPWSREIDVRITGMLVDNREAAQIAALLRLPVDVVQRRASQWQKRRERVERNKREHPDPMTGADGQPGLTLMELPDLGACKFGTHLPDIDGCARFCGRDAAPSQSWCAAHCDHVFEARARRCAA